jgi:hypothetical protein
VRNRHRAVLGNRLIVGGAVALFVSLFLTWSHQLPRSFLVLFGTSDLLRDVPRDPTAWQVYSAADVVMAALAVGLLLVALLGRRPARIIAAAAAVLGLAFTVHALSDPPTNGAANIFSPARAVPNYLPLSPGAGLGETIAIVALVVCLAGLALSVRRG